MTNEPSEGTPSLAILGFKNAFHGRTLGSATLTKSKPIYCMDVPKFEWPIANPPEYKYPLEGN